MFFSVYVDWVDLEGIVFVEKVIGETGGLEEGFEVEECHANSNYLTFCESL
jgi:hypothetical protein